MQVDIDALLDGPAVDAGVAALATRNAHHLQGMNPSEQQEAVGHWRELVVSVLTAARGAIGGAESTGPRAQEGPGRAVIVMEDAGNDDVAVHTAFFPELEELDSGEVAGTPAQVTALIMLESLSDDDEDGHEHGHDHPHEH